MRTKGAALGTAANWYDMPTKCATENIFNLSLQDIQLRCRPDNTPGHCEPWMALLSNLGILQRIVCSGTSPRYLFVHLS